MTATPYSLAVRGVWLKARRDLRVRHPQNRAVVPGQPGVGGECAEWRLSRVGAGAVLSGL